MMLSGVCGVGVLIVIQRLKVDVTGFKVSSSLVPSLVPHCITMVFWGVKFGMHLDASGRDHASSFISPAT